MKDIQVFDILKGGFSRGDANVENYIIYPIQKVEEKELQETEDKNVDETRLILTEPPCDVKWPQISLHAYLSLADLKLLQEKQTKKEIRKFIDSHIPKSCKDPPRTLFTELMYTIVKFSRNNEFNIKQTGALLSQFYLTHVIFTSSFNISAEKLYLYFKEIMLCHSVASPPDSIKIFSMDESEDIMDFFCKIYLRNLPLIRSMCLPNFAFHLNTFSETEPSLPNGTPEKVNKSKKKKKKK